jgi:hypothetical protein
MTRYGLYKILFGITLLLPFGQVQAAPSQTWNFKVYLDDQEIGEHRFVVSTQNNTRHVEVDAKFDVRVLFFTAYSYRHSNYEVWRQQCLQSIKSKTDDNGEQQYVEGEEHGKAFRVVTKLSNEQIDGCIKTFAYWDPDFLNSRQLLNAQTGKLMPVTIKEVGKKIIQVRGDSVESEQYRVITDEFSIDLWYSPQREWLALQSTTRDGSVLRYQLQ